MPSIPEEVGNNNSNKITEIPLSGILRQRSQKHCPGCVIDPAIDTVT